ncbi:MAG: tetratricopeptide repeat protein [Nitrospirae bacterium]|nr:tetratricopeptide repeat protein [Nitrospirota bacterium]
MIRKLRYLFFLCFTAGILLSSEYVYSDDHINNTAELTHTEDKSAKTDHALPRLTDFKSLSYYKVDNRFTNMEPYSTALIKKGEEALQNDQKTEAIAFFETAIALSPHLPQSYLNMAKATFSFSPKGFIGSVGYVLDAWKALTDNLWWSFKTAGMMLASIYIALFAAIGIFIALLALSKFRIYLHDIIEDRKKIFLMLPSVILVFLGPIFGIFALTLPFWVYLKKKEKALLYSLFFISAVAIFTIPYLSTFLNAHSEATLRSIINVNSTLYHGNTAYFEKGQEDYETIFSYALYKKQKGDYNEAIKTYENLLGKGNDAKIYNNMANCYVGLGDYKNAFLHYDKSLKSRDLASAYYNLSQLKNELFEFKDADAFYKKSLEVNADEVAIFTIIKGHSAKSAVVDEVIDNNGLRVLAFQRISGKAFSGRIGNIFTFVQAPFAIFLLLLITAAVTIYDKKTLNKAFRCQKCGRILCSGCEEEEIVEDDICPKCYKTLSRTTELNPKDRMSKKIEINRYREERNYKLRIMTLFLPGSGHIYFDELIPGFLFLFLFLFLISSAFIWGLLMPSVIMAPFAHTVTWLSIAGIIIFYFAVVMHILRKVD